MPAVPSLRSALDAAADAPVKLLSAVCELPGRTQEGVASVRRDGLARSLVPLAGGAALGALRLSASAISLGLDLLGRARGRQPAPDVSPFDLTDPPAHIDIDADDLPVEDFDHLTLGSLRARLPRLSLADVRALHAYEIEHAARLPVLTMLDNRIAKLAKTRG